MNNKDLFKSALKDEIPDLETVRRKCVESANHQKKKSIFITVLKSDLVLKKILPMAACIAITAVTVISFYSSDTPEKFITPPQYNGEEFNGKIPTAKTQKKKNKNDKNNNDQNENNGTQNNNYYNKNDKQGSQESSQNFEGNSTSVETKNKIHFAVPGVSKEYFSFSSVDELKSFISTLCYENDYVISNGESSFVLDIPYNKLSMFLEDKKFYTFSIGGETLSQNGIVEKYVVDNVTGCRFTVNYGETKYELGYSTYKYKKNTADGGEFENYQGHSVKIGENNTFFMNIDGYCFYVKAMTEDAEIATEFVKNLEINSINV